MNVAFFHAPSIGNHKEIFEEMMNRIESTGLIDSLDILFVNMVTGDIPEQRSSKIVYFKSGQNSDFEYPTLHALKSYCDGLHDDDNVLYIHLKGCSRSNGEVEKKKMDSWRDLLCYFTIDHHRRCLLELSSGSDACSVNYRSTPSPHFSGNFWWAKASLIKTLPNIDVDYQRRGRYWAEFWIGLNKDARMKSLYTDQHDFYLHGPLDTKVYRHE